MMPNPTLPLCPVDSRLPLSLAALAVPGVAHAAEASLLYKIYQDVGSGVTLLPLAALGLGIAVNPVFRSMDFHGKRLIQKLVGERRDTKTLETGTQRFYKINMAVHGAVAFAAMLAGAAAQQGHFEAAVVIGGAVLFGEAAVAVTERRIRSFLAGQARAFVDTQKKAGLANGLPARTTPVLARLDEAISAWKTLSLIEQIKIDGKSTRYQDLIAMRKDIQSWGKEIESIKYADELDGADAKFTARLKVANQSADSLLEKISPASSESGQMNLPTKREELV